MESWIDSEPVQQIPAERRTALACCFQKQPARNLTPKETHVALNTWLSADLILGMAKL